MERVQGGGKFAAVNVKSVMRGRLRFGVQEARNCCRLGALSLSSIFLLACFSGFGRDRRGGGEGRNDVDRWPQLLWRTHADYCEEGVRR